MNIYIYISIYIYIYIYIYILDYMDILTNNIQIYKLLNIN